MKSNVNVPRAGSLIEEAYQRYLLDCDLRKGKPKRWEELCEQAQTSYRLAAILARAINATPQVTEEGKAPIQADAASLQKPPPPVVGPRQDED